MTLPDDRRYSREHEWIRPEDGEGAIGLTKFAVDELGDIVYVELPEPNKQVARGDVLGTIESVKAVSEIYAPVAGTVVEVNDTLDASPETVNQDPHGEGWYCRLRVEAASEVEDLMDAAAYQKHVDAGAE